MGWKHNEISVIQNTITRIDGFITESLSVGSTLYIHQKGHAVYSRFIPKT